MIMVNSVAPTLMEHGTPEQKADFLPRIARGEINICVGYSEPGAGSDLASLATRAVRDGDDYVISGQKMWTSLASDADYCWLAVRTGEEVPPSGHLDHDRAPRCSPGIDIQPLDLLVDHDLCHGPLRRRPGSRDGRWSGRSTGGGG